MDNYIYILGANSEIGRELIKLKLEQNLNLCLLTTNSSKIETYIEELQLNTKSKIKIIDYDLSNSEETVSTLLRMSNEFIPKRIFVMVGYLGDRTGNNSDDEVKRIYNVNVNYLSKLFDSLQEVGYLENIKSVHFSSSVGADLFYVRLFHYYESKRLLNEYLQSLRTKLSKSQISIVNMKIGPVFDTEMGPSSGIFRLVASSKLDIAKNIIKGIDRNEDQYIPIVWKLIIAVYKVLPDLIKKKLKKII